MARVVRPEKEQTVLDSQLRDLVLFTKELVPDARIEISLERFEDEDAHVRVYPRPHFTQDQAQQVELALGQRCTEILLETGLFVIGAVYD